MRDVYPDTIVARVTPAGRGGVAIVRASGPGVQHLILKLFGTPLTPRMATYLPFRNAQHELIDEGLALFFEGPNSFTGEDVLELQGHGSPVVVDQLLAYLIGLGARLARPGEFSERAFLNGKIDLAQAEAIADLIESTSLRAAKLAVRSLQGDFSKAVHVITQQVIHLRTHLEATIDFVDEDIDPLAHTHHLLHLQKINQAISLLQKNAKQGSLLREGVTLVITGEPNVGKSSLLNSLTQTEAAIVTDIPGTTRDVLHHEIVIDGLPIHVIDTAGLRDSDDVIEQEGIRRAKQALQSADIVLYVLDVRHHSTFEPTIWLREVAGDATPHLIIVLNKIDLVQASPAVLIRENVHWVSLSAKTGAGLDLLKTAIYTAAGLQHQEEGLFLARRRHLDALSRAASHIQAALNLNSPAASELMAEELRLAQQALNTITGEFTSDDLLGEIFSTFCIGK
jgi:tRNA modification GTPase